MALKLESLHAAKILKSVITSLILKQVSKNDVKKMHLISAGLKEIRLSEKISIFAGSSSDPIVLLVPGTIITKMPERVEYEVEFVDIGDIKNPQVVVSRGNKLFTVTKDQLKKDFDVG